MRTHITVLAVLLLAAERVAAIADIDQIPVQLEPFEATPCNGHPDYCHLPVDYFAWIGTHNSGAFELRDIEEIHTDYLRSQEFQCGYINHDQNISTMLEDGVRFLDADLCLWKDGQPYLCHATHGGTSLGLVDGYGVLFADFLREIFKLFATKKHQAIVVHLSDNVSNNPDFRVNLEQVERAIDEVCREFSDTPESYVECPDVYTQTDAGDPWPTMADLVGKTAKSSSVKNRLIFTNSGDFAAPGGYNTRYVSQMFWQSTYFPNQELKDIKAHLHQMCKAPGGIGYEAILGFKFPHCLKELTPLIYTPSFLEDSLYAADGCNLFQTPLSTRLNMLVVDYYRAHWEYLKKLQKALLVINAAKWAAIDQKKNSSAPPTPIKQAVPTRTGVRVEL